MLTNVFVQKLNLQNSQKLDILIKIKKLSETVWKANIWFVYLGHKNSRQYFPEL